jgi:hypothetical protein
MHRTNSDISVYICFGVPGGIHTANTRCLYTHGSQGDFEGTLILRLDETLILKLEGTSVLGKEGPSILNMAHCFVCTRLQAGAKVSDWG